MKITLRLVIFSLGSIIFLAICSWAFWYLGGIIQQSRPAFTAYYSKSIITRFDQNVSPMGFLEIYRIDGIKGSPKKIYTSPTEQEVSAQIQFIREKLVHTIYPKFQEMEGALSSVGVQTIIDSRGHIVTTNSTKPVNTLPYPPSTTLSPDGHYSVTTSLRCTPEVLEGPCGTVFVMSIFDFETSTTHEVEPTAFGLPDGSAMKADVLDYISPTVALILINDAQELYRQILGRLDLTTGKVDVIWKNIKNATETTGQTFQFQWLQPDKVSMIAIERNITPDTLADRFVSVNLQSTTVTGLSDTIKGYPAMLTNDFRGYYYSPGFNQGEWFHDIAKNRDERITPNGEITDFQVDDRYIPITLFRNNNGNGPKMYSIYDRRKKKNKVIYEQQVAPWGELPNVNGTDTNAAHVGDAVYNFIGIDQ